MLLNETIHALVLLRFPCVSTVLYLQIIYSSSVVIADSFRRTILRISAIPGLSGDFFKNKTHVSFF